MARIGDLQYRVEYTVCGRQFVVDSISAKIPKHPPKGEAREPYVPYIPCIGSGLVGRVIEPKIKGFD